MRSPITKLWRRSTRTTSSAGSRCERSATAVAMPPNPPPSTSTRCMAAILRATTVRQNRSRSPTATTAGPSAKRTCAASSWTPSAKRRGPSEATQRPSRPASGPLRTRTRSGGGSVKSRSGSSKTSAGGSLTIATSRPSSASSRPTTGPAIDRRIAPSSTRTANGGSRWSAALWRASDAIQSRRSLLGRAATTIPRTPIARARVKVSASTRAPTTRIVPARPTSRPPGRSSPLGPVASLRRPRVGPPSATMPRRARPAARTTIRTPGWTSRTIPLTGASRGSPCSPLAMRQPSRHGKSSSPPLRRAVLREGPRRAGASTGVQRSPGRASSPRGTVVAARTVSRNRSASESPTVTAEPSSTITRSPGARANRMSTASSISGRSGTRSRPWAWMWPFGASPLTGRDPPTAMPATSPAARAAGRGVRAAATGRRAGRRAARPGRRPPRPRTAGPCRRVGRSP